VQTLPLAGSNSWRGITVEGVPLENFEDRKSVGYLVIEDQYFAALDVPVLHGRALEGADMDEGANVVAVNQSFVERYWPRGENPIGRRLRFGWEPPPGKEPEEPWLSIVGVVADIRFSGLDDPPRPEIYVPYRNDGPRSMAVVLETRQDPASLATLVRETVTRLDPDQPVYNLRTIEEMLQSAGGVGGMRAIAQIMGTLAIGALGLAAIGIYGVITFTMSQRRQEIGIRRAVGAERWHILLLTMRQALVPVTLGLVIGLGLSIAGGRSLRGLLFGAQDANPVTYVVALGGLLAVAIAASLLPAARATRVDPLVVLRHE
jgi:predicted permease